MSGASVVLATGVSGYLGANLCRRLVEQGREVHGIVRAGSDLALFESILGARRSAVRLHAHDGSTEGMIALVAQARPASCFHLASLFKAAHQPSDISGLIESNLLFGIQLAEALVRAGTRFLVNTGTSWQNFEGRPYSPVALYAATKQAFQDLLAYYAEAEGLSAIHLKLTDTFGPGDPRRKVLNIVHQAAMKGTPLEMSGGEQLVDLVYLDDVIEGFLAAERRCRELAPGAQEIYRLSSGQPVTLRALVESFEEVLGRKIPVVWGKLPYRKREMFRAWEGEGFPPSWHPQISLKEGIRSIVQHGAG